MVCASINKSLRTALLVKVSVLRTVRRRICGKTVTIDREMLGVNWPARPALYQGLAGN